ncbi:transmembrane protein [Salpingoeca rosetta]|uniref:Transmembrane protein n=1 Tax=Salpingoeca rosetta (strain ATCC 50818 / BSB-021) TaxID=946362 RepID=F2UBG1_SALR5|nr:uncharacterized protein PTSG_12334 [Salpingoeca rosetta]EGD73827.1 transmembrane protein [Salpingoeca rosetta]|eukprot:XP_004993390.1 transmembrane protein [Salpingoeca rosetta]
MTATGSRRDDDDATEQLVTSNTNTTTTVMVSESSRSGSRGSGSIGGVIAGQIDASRNRFPFCVVWTPLPLISWILPFIGHVGIASSNGVIYDFAGPYFVSVDNMAFGRPTKYWQLDPKRASSDWDSAVISGSEEYRKHMHNLFCDNCHSHVALCLNNMAYGGKRNWTMVSVALHLVLHSHYVSFGRFLLTYLPFLVIVTMVVLLVLFA